MDEALDGSIDADKLTEPLVFCVISGGENGWFNCDARTTAKTAGEARALANAFLEQVFPGKRKVVRAAPEADEQRDFQFGCRVVRGYCRFAFRLEDGPTEQRAQSDEVVYAGFGGQGEAV